MIDTIQLYSKEIEKYINELAQLRMEVFYEFPYLYEGSLEYEKKYLSRYISASDSMVVLLKDGDKVIGMSSCLPLEEEEEAFKKPFENEKIDISKVMYFGESIIKKEYRGRGLGKEFFSLRERHAKRVIQNLLFTAFCAVEREKDHPLRPKNYRALDKFWKSQGYEKNQNLKVLYPWCDRGEELESYKSLSFWLKNWS